MLFGKNNAVPNDIVKAFAVVKFVSKDRVPRKAVIENVDVAWELRVFYIAVVLFRLDLGVPFLNGKPPDLAAVRFDDRVGVFIGENRSLAPMIPHKIHAAAILDELGGALLRDLLFAAGFQTIPQKASYIFVGLGKVSLEILALRIDKTLNKLFAELPCVSRFNNFKVHVFICARVVRKRS